MKKIKYILLTGLLLPIQLFSAKVNPELIQELNVFAASSLSDVFTELKRNFEMQNPLAKIHLNFAGSQVLRVQIEHGAKADVFVSADKNHIQALIKMNYIGESSVFARNELAIIVPADNPAKIKNLADLKSAKRLVIGVPNVPIGMYTRELLKKANAVFGADFEETVMKKVVSQESNVRLVRAKVELSEADAAVVYRTDAISSKRIKAIVIPPDLNIATDYHISMLKSSKEKIMGGKWIDYLYSEEAKKILHQYGFITKRARE